MGHVRNALFATPSTARALGATPVDPRKVAEVPFVTPIYNVNGQFVPHSQAVVHIEDRGYQLADAVYEVWALLQERDPDKNDDYFSNSVKLLCMIVISENWWAP